MKVLNIFKKKIKEAKNTKVEKINKDKLKNLTGGGEPIPGIDVKLGHK